jgi:prepilin-type N-terminal cleavage/methylation domain-containing protein
MVTCRLPAVPSCPIRIQRGFSLLEMAVVMVVIGLLLGGLLMPLATQRDINNRKASQTQLDEIVQAITGFAIINGRLPCPASATSNGEALASCANAQQHGYVPARTLGLTGPMDAQNRLLDSWNQPIRYSVHTGYSNTIAIPLPNSDFRVCRNTACAASDILADNLAAVVLSTGKDGAVGNVSADQLSNRKVDPNDNPRSNTSNFVSRTMTDDFDDIVVWLSPNSLVLNLTRSGTLQPPANSGNTGNNGNSGNTGNNGNNGNGNNGNGNGNNGNGSGNGNSGNAGNPPDWTPPGGNTGTPPGQGGNQGQGNRGQTN